MEENVIGKRGVIFDMDGVISDTQNMHSEVESQFLRSLNIHIHPDEITARFAGVGDKQMLTTLFAEHGVSHPLEQIRKEKWHKIAEMVEEKGIQAVPHAVELIKLLYDNGFLLAVASGSPKTFIDQVIEALSLKQYFAAFVSADDVRHGKPAPDVFLEAAKQAAIDLNECVIIEDGLSGMQAAASAKIPCIGLVADKDRSYPATVLVTSLKEVTIELVMQLQTNKKSLPV